MTPADMLIEESILEIKAALDAPHTTLIDGFRVVKVTNRLQKKGIAIGLTEQQKARLTELRIQLAGFFQ